MHKCFYLIFGFLFLIAAVNAQIPNAGFEDWTDGEPNDWLTNNSLAAGFITRTTDAHSGDAAVQGTVQYFFTIPFSPMLSSGEEGFPVTSKPGSLRGYYKFTSFGNDTLAVGIFLSQNQVAVGGGAFITATSTEVYQEFVANIEYNPSATPDTAWITVIIFNTDSVHVGSTFIIDDLSFGSATSVSEEGTPDYNTFNLSQNYPNPFNPQTRIAYQLAEPSHVTVGVYDVLGKQVAILVDQNQSGGEHEVFFNGSDLPSGVYFYRMTAINSSGIVFTKTNKLLIKK